MRKIVIPDLDCPIVEHTISKVLERSAVAAVTPRLFSIEEPQAFVVEGLADRIITRAHLGNAFYGCTLTEQTMSPIQALREAEEELIDTIAYLGKYLQGIVANEDKIERVSCIVYGVTDLLLKVSTIIYEVENDYAAQIPSDT